MSFQEERTQNPPSMLSLLKAEMEINEKRHFYNDYYHISRDSCVSQWEASKVCVELHSIRGCTWTYYTHLLGISIHFNKSNISLFQKRLKQTCLLDRLNTNDRHPDMSKQWSRAHPMCRCRQVKVWVKGQKRSYRGRWVLAEMLMAPLQGNSV